jgi:hypothetical protein
VNATASSSSGGGRDAAVHTDANGLSTIWIPMGAHHLDLFFADPADPPSVTQARVAEMALVQQWVAAWYAQRGEAVVAAAAA